LFLLARSPLRVSLHFRKGNQVMNTKSIKRAVLAALLVSGTVATAYAANADATAYVTDVRVGIGTPSVGVIGIAVVPAVRPTCATYGGSRAGAYFGVDLSTDGGREALRLATAAQLSGKLVRVVGAGVCTANSNKEDLAQIYLQ
jgi:hypothetical protein